MTCPHQFPGSIKLRFSAEEFARLAVRLPQAKSMQAGALRILLTSGTILDSGYSQQTKRADCTRILNLYPSEKERQTLATKTDGFSSVPQWAKSVLLSAPELPVDERYSIHPPKVPAVSDGKRPTLVLIAISLQLEELARSAITHHPTEFATLRLLVALRDIATRAEEVAGAEATSDFETPNRSGAGSNSEA